MEQHSQSSRMAPGDDLMVGHVHARSAPEREASDHSQRVVKRRLRTKTSMASLERGRAAVPELLRLRALRRDPEGIPVSETSAAASTSPRSGSVRAHPYNPVGEAIGGSFFEYVPSLANRATSKNGFDESRDVTPIPRSNSFPSLLKNPIQGEKMVHSCAHMSSCTRGQEFRHRI